MKKLLPLVVLLVALAGCTSSCGSQDVQASLPPETSETLPTPENSGAPDWESPPQLSSAPSPERSADPQVSLSPVPTTSQMEKPAQTSGGIQEPVVSPTAVPLSGPDDETVLAAYRQAVDAFWWFQVAPMSFDPADSREVDGMVYYRVDQPGISSTASLRGYLKGLFSDALVEQLLPYGGTQYIDIDGVLYVQDGGRGTDITRGAEYTQVLRDDNPNRVVVQVTVEVVDPEQDGAVTDTVIYQFPYEKVGERWIFTEFALVR